MLRIRFKLRCLEVGGDFRPVIWPILYPYWCTGETLGKDIYGESDEECFVVVAYVENEEQLKRWWPEAFDLEVEKVDKIEFSDRFPKPKWYPIKTECPIDVVRTKNEVARKIRQMVCQTVLRDNEAVVTDNMYLGRRDLENVMRKLSAYFSIEFSAEEVDICTNNNVRQLIEVVCDELKEKGETIKEPKG